MTQFHGYITASLDASLDELVEYLPRFLSHSHPRHTFCIARHAQMPRTQSPQRAAPALVQSLSPARRGGVDHRWIKLFVARPGVVGVHLGQSTFRVSPYGRHHAGAQSWHSSQLCQTLHDGLVAVVVDASVDEPFHALSISFSLNRIKAYRSQHAANTVIITDYHQ